LEKAKSGDVIGFTAIISKLKIAKENRA